ncbi:MAG: DUF2156 domain-containing protein [Opitutales bacterium]|nr:DUF2156 domain-containing protein [Opitutales bacterium]
MVKLRKILLSDKTEFEKHHPSKDIGCESSFAVNFLYAKDYPTYIGNWHNRIAIAKPPNLLYYPLGEETSAKELAEYAEDISNSGFKFEYIYNVPPDFAKNFPDYEKYFSLVENEGEFDYIYQPDSLAELKGSLLRKKRNHIKHFIEENPNWCEDDITQKNLDDAQFFVESRSTAFERQAIETAFENFFELNLSGIILRDNDGTIVGTSIFTEIADGVYDVLIEKSAHHTRGASQMLVVLQAKKLRELGAKLINREQDLNLPNLRHAKKSLDPIFLYKRVSLVPKNYARN